MDVPVAAAGGCSSDLDVASVGSSYDSILAADLGTLPEEGLKEIGGKLYLWERYHVTVEEDAIDISTPFTRQCYGKLSRNRLVFKYYKTFEEQNPVKKLQIPSRLRFFLNIVKGFRWLHRYNMENDQKVFIDYSPNRLWVSEKGIPKIRFQKYSRARSEKELFDILVSFFSVILYEVFDETKGHSDPGLLSYDSSSIEQDDFHSLIVERLPGLYRKIGESYPSDDSAGYSLETLQKAVEAQYTSYLWDEPTDASKKTKEQQKHFVQLRNWWQELSNVNFVSLHLVKGNLRKLADLILSGVSDEQLGRATELLGSCPTEIVRIEDMKRLFLIFGPQVQDSRDIFSRIDGFFEKKNFLGNISFEEVVLLCRGQSILRVSSRAPCLTISTLIKGEVPRLHHQRVSPNAPIEWIFEQIDKLEQILQQNPDTERVKHKSSLQANQM